MASYAFVVAQFACLAALLLPLPPLTSLLWPGGPPIAVGIALALWATRANRPGNFNIRPDPKPDGELVTSGPYRIVRHPMYVAALLAASGLALAQGQWWRWLVGGVLVLVLERKAAREERALAAQFPGYAAYAARTPRFLPKLR